MLEEQSDLESELVDLTDIPLVELPTCDDSALTLALRRVTREVGESRNVIAGFQSGI